MQANLAYNFKRLALENDFRLRQYLIENGISVQKEDECTTTNTTTSLEIRQIDVIVDSRTLQFREPVAPTSEPSRRLAEARWSPLFPVPLSSANALIIETQPRRPWYKTRQPPGLLYHTGQSSDRFKSKWSPKNFRPWRSIHHLPPAPHQESHWPALQTATWWGQLLPRFDHLWWSLITPTFKIWAQSTWLEVSSHSLESLAQVDTKKLKAYLPNQYQQKL